MKKVVSSNLNTIIIKTNITKVIFTTTINVNTVLLFFSLSLFKDLLKMLEATATTSESESEAS